MKIITDTLHIILHQAEKESIISSHWIWIYLILLLLIAAFLITNKSKVKELISRIRPKEYKINIPGFSLEGSIQYNTLDQEVAWKIYVELVTRVSGSGLQEQTGILREALNSLYILFGALRETLKNSGSELAKDPPKGKTFTIASLLILILNVHLRPFLSKWHPLLEDYEHTRESTISQYGHEKKWELNNEFRLELFKLKEGLQVYTDILKNIAKGGV